MKTNWNTQQNVKFKLHNDKVLWCNQCDLLIVAPECSFLWQPLNIIQTPPILQVPGNCFAFPKDFQQTFNYQTLTSSWWWCCSVQPVRWKKWRLVSHFEMHWDALRCISDSKILPQSMLHAWKLLRSVFKLFKLGHMFNFSTYQYH